MNKLSEQATDATKENSTTQVLETVEFKETIDLSPLAESSRFLEIELPNFYKKLLELQAETREVTLKDIRVNLTNINDESFGGSDSNNIDWIMLDWFIRVKNIEITRVTFKAVNYIPFENTIVVYFNNKGSKKTAEIGRINWRQIDDRLWWTYWIKGVTLTYNVNLES